MGWLDYSDVKLELGFVAVFVFVFHNSFILVLRFFYPGFLGFESKIKTFPWANNRISTSQSLMAIIWVLVHLTLFQATEELFLLFNHPSALQVAGCFHFALQLCPGLSESQEISLHPDALPQTLATHCLALNEGLCVQEQPFSVPFCQAAAFHKWDLYIVGVFCPCLACGLQHSCT